MIWDKINPHLAHIDLPAHKVEILHGQYQKAAELIDFNNKSILDYGCGGGYFAEWLHSNYNVKDYIGYDISNRSIIEANIRQPSNYITTLPTKQYDVIVCLAVIQHCSSVEIQDIVDYIAQSKAKEVILNIRYGKEKYSNNIVNRSHLPLLYIPNYIVTDKSLIYKDQYQYIKYDLQ